MIVLHNLQVDNVATQMRNMHAELKKAEAQSQQYNSREVLFGLELTDYTRIKKMLEQFDPFMQVPIMKPVLRQPIISQY